MRAFRDKINTKYKDTPSELFQSLKDIDTEHLLRNKEIILEYIQSINNKNNDEELDILSNLNHELSYDIEESLDDVVDIDLNDIYIDFILKKLNQSKKTSLDEIKRINNYLDNHLSSKGSIELFINLNVISIFSRDLIVEYKSYSESINIMDKIEDIKDRISNDSYKLGTDKIKLIYELTYQGFHSESIKIIDEIDLSLRLQGYCRVCLAYFNKKNQVEFHKLFNRIKDELYNAFNISDEDIKREQIKQQRTGISNLPDLYDILDYWLRFNELNEVITFLEKNYTKSIFDKKEIEDLLVKIFKNLHKLGRTEEIGDLMKKLGYNKLHRLNMEIIYATDIDFFIKLLTTKFNKNIDSEIVKSIEEVLPIHLSDLKMVNYLTCYLIDFPSSLKSLFRKYYMHKLIFDDYNDEELDILSKNTNFNWALDLLNKISNKSEDEYLFSNINSWIDKIDDDDDKQQIKLWERMVSKGRINENEFNKNLKDFL